MATQIERRHHRTLTANNEVSDEMVEVEIPKDLQCFLCYPGYSPSKDRKSCNRIWFPTSRKCVFHSRGNKAKPTNKEFCYQCVEGFFPDTNSDGSYECVKHSEKESCAYYDWNSGSRSCSQCERLGGYFAVNTDPQNGQTCSHDKGQDLRTEAWKHAPFWNGWFILEIIGVIILLFVIMKVVLFLKNKREVEDEEHLHHHHHHHHHHPHHHKHEEHHDYTDVGSIMDN